MYKIFTDGIKGLESNELFLTDQNGYILYKKDDEDKVVKKLGFDEEDAKYFKEDGWDLRDYIGTFDGGEELLIENGEYMDSINIKISECIDMIDKYEEEELCNLIKKTDNFHMAVDKIIKLQAIYVFNKKLSELMNVGVKELNDGKFEWN